MNRIFWIIKAIWLGIRHKDVEASQILTAEIAHESRLLG